MLGNERTKMDAILKWGETPSGVLLITYESFTLHTELTRRKVCVAVTTLLSDKVFKFHNRIFLPQKEDAYQ